MSSTETDSVTVQSHNIPCSQCGYRLEFAPEQGALKCPQCFTVNRIRSPSAAEYWEAHAELDLQAALASQFETLPRHTVQIVVCSSCGAGIQLPVQVAAQRCPFCMTPMIVDQVKAHKTVLPSGILPFRITKEQACKYLFQWLDQHGMPWRQLDRIRVADSLFGVYLPFWTFDVPFSVEYSGSRGDKQLLNERSAKPDGEGYVWTKLTGTFEAVLDDILIPAMRSFPGPLKALRDWSLEELEPYKDDYVLGFASCLGTVDLNESLPQLKEARAAFDQEVYSWIRHEIGGERQRGISLDGMRFDAMTFKYIQLPIWMASYKYEDELYYFLVNRHAGQVAGEYPKSIVESAKTAKRICIGVLAVLGYLVLLTLSLPSGFLFFTLYVWLLAAVVPYLKKLSPDSGHLKYFNTPWEAEKRPSIESTDASDTATAVPEKMPEPSPPKEGDSVGPLVILLLVLFILIVSETVLLPGRPTLKGVAKTYSTPSTPLEYSRPSVESATVHPNQEILTNGQFEHHAKRAKHPATSDTADAELDLSRSPTAPLQQRRTVAPRLQSPVVAQRQVKQIWKYADEDGNSHYVESLENVPTRFRGKAVHID